MLCAYFNAQSQIVPPTVTTNSARVILNELMVELKGDVTSNGGSVIIESGMVWSGVTANPTTTDNESSMISSGPHMGPFTYKDYLPKRTIVYVRAFATNAAGTGYGQSLKYYVTDPILELIPNVIPSATVGQEYNLTFSVKDSSNPYNYYVTEGALPTGLLLDDETGVVSGTPSVTGIFNFKIQATERIWAVLPGWGDKSYSISVAPPPTIPIVTTGVATSISSTSAFLGGNVTADGGATVSEKGIVWSTTVNPTTTNNKVPIGSGIGAFAKTVSSLPSNTLIHYRAYAINSTGTSYGPGLTFTTLPSPLVITPVTLPNPTHYVLYNQTISTSGGSGVYDYLISSGSLPQGITISPVGVLSGEPLVSGLFNFTITAVDKGSLISNSKSYSFIVNPAILVINPDLIPDAAIGKTYSQTFIASGGKASYNYSITAGAVPNGLTLSPGGVLSGIPTLAGTFKFTLMVRDSSTPGYYAFLKDYELVVSPSPIVLPTVTAIVASGITSNSAILGGNVTDHGGAAVTERGIVWSTTANPTTTNNKVPMGVGTGTFAETVSSLPSNTPIYYRAYAINSKGTSYGTSLTLTTLPAPLVIITPNSLPNGTFGKVYNQPITVNGGTAPYTYEVTSGSLPTNLEIDRNNGIISGTPIFSGTSNFTITVKDASTGTVPYTVAKSFSINVAAVIPRVNTFIPSSITLTSAIAGGHILDGGGITVTERGIVWSTTANPTTANNKVPMGNGTGTFTAEISSLPVATRIYYRAYAINAIGTGYGTDADFKTLGPTLVFTPSALADAKVGAAYSKSFSVSGGLAPYSFEVVSGALPAGLTISNSILSGTPTTAGTFNFTIKTIDASPFPGPYSVSQSYTLVVDPPSIALVPATLPNPAVAAPYRHAITASGGIAPYTYAITRGSLPAGLTISSDGVISGTATAGGTFNFTVAATNSSTGTGAPHSGSQAYTIAVAAPTVTLNPTSLPRATALSGYSETFTSSGGTAPYTYTITLGVLPRGLTLSPDGVLSGTPTVAGLFGITITTKDSSTGNGPYGTSKAYSLSIFSPVVMEPAVLPDMEYAVFYNQTLNSSGGVAPYSYSLSTGILPPGVTLSPTGVISGTPRESGSFPVSVQSTDAGGLIANNIYHLSVSRPSMEVTPLTLPDPVFGEAYHQPLASSGGISPYRYTILPASVLPLGLSLSSTGVLSGTPTSAGNFTFTVNSTDSGIASGTKIYTLYIAPPNLVITTGVLPEVTVGMAYYQTLSTSGGNTPYSYSLQSGSLPTGMSISADGVISGTPTAKGTYNFVIRSTDSSIGSGPYYADKNFSIVVHGKEQVITMAPTATVNYGDADFDPGATSDSGLPIIYSSSNSAIASIVDGKVHIVGAGQVTIFADQTGDDSFDATVQQQQTLIINKAELQYVANTATKVYGAVNPALNGTLTGFKYADDLAGSTIGTALFITTATTTSGVGSYAINGSGLTSANYTFVQATANATALSITPKELTVTADSKEKFFGETNPLLTASYNGFVNGENETVVSTKAVLATDATTGSAVGPYDINVSGATAANYTFKYVKGVLTIKPGAATDISLAVVTLYENQPSGTIAGTLNSVSADPSATFIYTLIPGFDDTDNHLFSISTNKLNTAASLDFEQKAIYSVRVRSTNQYGLSFEKVLNVTIADVNEIPTLDAISNQSICATTNLQTVALSGISAGQESGQTLDVTVSSSNAALFESLTVDRSGVTGSVNYRVKSGVVGTATVTVLVKDDGGTANGGEDTFSQTFVITVNPQPVLSINSDKGNIVSKGEVLFLTATGASNFIWTGDGIISGSNSAVLEIRPTVTTTYTLIGNNFGGCNVTQTFTVTVLDDLDKIKATNILTPNNDGYNDKWIVDNIDVYPDNEVKIFDRAGRILYTKKGYDNSWDGTMNGTALAEGTYYYVIDFGPAKRKLRGYITLIREN